MYSSLVFLAAAFGAVSALPSPQAPGTVALGGQCSSSSDCANGANCYAVNSMLIPTCGNFQASCSSDSQCAFNTCNEGLCNGFKASTTTSAPVATSTATPGTAALGKQCSSSADCANGANCYAVNSMLIPACGNFQAACSSDSQCAFNTCKDGLCSGFKASTTTSAPVSTSTPVSGTVGLGGQCKSSSDCANGANCYAVNSMLIPVCGNFQAACSSDLQCAFNTCQNGLCSGFKASTTTTSTGATSTPSSTPLPLGANCTPDSSVCANGANCYATNSMLQPRCGNFAAKCTSDSQCAFNLCNTDTSLCTGPLPTSSMTTVVHTTVVTVNPCVATY